MAVYGYTQRFQVEEEGTGKIYAFFFKDNVFSRLICWDDSTETEYFDLAKEELDESYVSEAILVLCKSKKVFEFEGNKDWITYKEFMQLMNKDEKFGPITRKIILREIERMSAQIVALTRGFN